MFIITSILSGIAIGAIRRISVALAGTKMNASDKRDLTSPLSTCLCSCFSLCDFFFIVIFISEDLTSKNINSALINVIITGYEVRRFIVKPQFYSIFPNMKEHEDKLYSIIRVLFSDCQLIEADTVIKPAVYYPWY